MDEATAIKILQNYGAPMTPENMQKVMMQGGDPSAILGKSMGLQQGMDESGNALDKLAFASARNPGIAAAPLAPPSPTAVVSDASPAGINRAPPTQTRGGQYNADQNLGPPPPSNGPAASGDTSFLPWLLAALGVGSTAGRNAMGKAVGPSSMPQLEGPGEQRRLTYQGKLEGPEGQPRLEAPASNTNVVGKRIPTTETTGGAPTRQELYDEPIDKIAQRSESRRPTNTNADGRNAQLKNKPVNLDSRSVPIDDAIPINVEPPPTLKELVAKLRRGVHR